MSKRSMLSPTKPQVKPAVFSYDEQLNKQKEGRAEARPKISSDASRCPTPRVMQVAMLHAMLVMPVFDSLAPNSRLPRRNGNFCLLGVPGPSGMTCADIRFCVLSHAMSIESMLRQTKQGWGSFHFAIGCGRWFRTVSRFCMHNKKFSKKFPSPFRRNV